MLEADDGTVLAAHGEAIGVATNNAEYRALVEGLRKAVDLSVDEVEVVSDSELLVKQMRGEYKVKNAALRESLEAAARATPRAGDLHRRQARAHQLADRLVNEARRRVMEAGPLLVRRGRPPVDTLRCDREGLPSTPPVVSEDEIE